MRDIPGYPDTARLPAGLTVTAIGDVHGHLELLNPYLEAAEARALRQPGRRHIVIMLGDLIDRGPDSAGVVERLCHGLLHCELVALRGNHEEAMLSFLAGRPSGRQWLEFGGKETLRSYGVDLTTLGRGKTTVEDLRTALAARLPQAHLDFLSAMPTSFELGDYIFVHAGLRPGVAIAAQSEQDMVWIRDEFLRWNGAFEKKVVHGHTPAAEPEFRANRINLDTGAYATGRLTAAVLEDAFVALI